MNENKRYELLEKNNIRASVLTDWSPSSNRNCKFTPGQRVAVKFSTRNSEGGRYTKYVGQRGRVIAASTFDGEHMRSPDGVSRQFTRYFVSFPKMKNKVVGLHSHYLRPVKS
jgi:hypothetical protein